MFKRMSRKKFTLLGVTALMLVGISVAAAPGASAAQGCTYTAYNPVGSVDSMYFRGSYVCEKVESFTFFLALNEQHQYRDGHVEDRKYDWNLDSKFVNGGKYRSGEVDAKTLIAGCYQDQFADVVAVRVRSVAWIGWYNGGATQITRSDWGAWLNCDR